MNFRCKPLYLKYPIWQTTFTLFWLICGYTISLLPTGITMVILTKIMLHTLEFIFTDAFMLFHFSGRTQALFLQMFPIVRITFFILILIIGLEIISHFMNKKLEAGGFDDDTYEED